MKKRKTFRYFFLITSLFFSSPLLIFILLFAEDVKFSFVYPIVLFDFLFLFHALLLFLISHEINYKMFTISLKMIRQNENYTKYLKCFLHWFFNLHFDSNQIEKKRNFNSIKNNNETELMTFGGIFLWKFIHFQIDTFFAVSCLFSWTTSPIIIFDFLLAFASTFLFLYLLSSTFTIFPHAFSSLI